MMQSTTTQNAIVILLVPFPLFVCLPNALSHKNHHQPRRRRPSLRYAPNAASSRNLGKAVVAVAAVRGSKAVEVLVRQDFSTLGTRACMPVKHGDSP